MCNFVISCSCLAVIVIDIEYFVEDLAIITLTRILEKYSTRITLRLFKLPFDNMGFISQNPFP
jgi:hypothetical protein